MQIINFFDAHIHIERGAVAQSVRFHLGETKFEVAVNVERQMRVVGPTISVNNELFEGEIVLTILPDGHLRVSTKQDFLVAT